MDMIITIQDQNTNSHIVEIYLMDPVNEIWKLVYTIQNSGIFVGDFNGDKL